MAKHPVRQTGEDAADPESWAVDTTPKEAEKPAKKSGSK